MKVYRIARISRNFDDYPGFQPNQYLPKDMQHSVFTTTTKNDHTAGNALGICFSGCKYRSFHRHAAALAAGEGMTGLAYLITSLLKLLKN